MSKTPSKDNSNSRSQTPLAESPSYATLFNAVYSYETPTYKVGKANEDNSGSEYFELKSSWSNKAEVDETEISELWTDDLLEQEYEPPVTMTQRLEAVIPKHLVDSYKAESANRPCYCTWHDSDSDEEQVSPQHKGGSLTPEQRDAEYSSSGNFTLNRGQLSLAQDRCYHVTIYRDVYPKKETTATRIKYRRT